MSCSKKKGRFTKLKVALIGGVVVSLLTSAKLDANEDFYYTSTTTRSNSSLIGQVATDPPPTDKNAESRKLEYWKLSSGILSAFVLLYLIILWKRPLWLLYLPSDLPLSDIKFLSLLSKIPSPAILWLKYQPRVLDAWVAERIDQVQEEFERRLTVKQRRQYVSLPVEFDDKKQPICLTASSPELRKTFAREEFCLLIAGEGGSGKTSLACQIAKWAMATDLAENVCGHRMIPALIEDELERTADNQSPILVSVIQQLKNLRIEEKQISEELLKQLLQKRRILVIVDHLSEMSDYSREAIRKVFRRNDVSSPINALIVTSRVEGILGKESTCTIVNPLRFSGTQLSIFMDTYLRQLGKRELFHDVEYFAALGHLSQIVTEEDGITVLFAKLYAEQMVAIAEGKKREELPKNLPDLMLDYLNELNRNQVVNKLPDPIVHRDAQVVAWQCLKSSFKPEFADRSEVLNAIAALEGQENSKEIAEQHLQYLENEPLHLIRLIPPAKKRIRFSLDPLAEYLAALYVVEHCQNDPVTWRTFIEEAKDKPGSLEDIKGFCSAIRYCCLARPELKVPEFVIDELSKLADLDLELLREEQLRRRIQRLTTYLSLPDERDRIYALEELQALGSSTKAISLLAREALPVLLKAVDDPVQEVRASAMTAIPNLNLLSEADLRQAFPGIEQTISSLVSTLEDEDELIKMLAIDALANIGSLAIPALEKALDNKNRYVRFRSIETLTNLEITAIPALERATRNKSSYIRSEATVALEKLRSK